MTTPTALIQAIKAKLFRTHPMDNDMAIYQSDLLPILEAYFVEPPSPVTVELYHYFQPDDYWRLDIACSVCKWEAEASYEAKPRYVRPPDISIDVWLKDLAQTASVGAVYANCPHATRQYLEPILAAKIRELLKEEEKHLEAHFAEPVVDFASLLKELKTVGYITLQEEKEEQSGRETIHSHRGG